MSDVKLDGLSPTDEVGEQFHCTIWEWRPIRKIIEEAHGDVFPWGTNDAELSHTECTELSTELHDWLEENGEGEFSFIMNGRTYSVEREKLYELIAFLMDCGGFKSQ